MAGADLSNELVPAILFAVYQSIWTTVKIAVRARESCVITGLNPVPKKNHQLTKHFMPASNRVANGWWILVEGA